MRGTVFSRLRLGTKRLFRDQRGNAFMLTAAAIVPVIGIVGSGVDIGRAYMTQLRLQQACDAGVLAGRRAMAAGQYTAAAKVQANKMFATNFPTDIYGSNSVEFDSKPLGATDVEGTAKAVLPTAIMFIFGRSEFDLTASCAAKLEISNTDVMLVLDVTGSMKETTSDGKERMAALKDAAMVFFDTLTTADMGDGRLRFGIVPYSSSVNVGKILYKKNPNWLSNYMLVPSRSPIVKVTWSGSTVPSGATGTPTQTAPIVWEDVLPISGYNATAAACSDLTPPADTAVTSAAIVSANRTTYFVDKDDVRRYVNDDKTKHSYIKYRYNRAGDGKCWLQRSIFALTHTAVANPTKAFRNQYRYEDRLFDVSDTKSSNSLTADTGDSGADRTYTWSGCIMERRTTAFGATTTAPAEALDMNVDAVPTSAEESKWQILVPEVAFPRSYNVGSKPTFAKKSSEGILDVSGRMLKIDSSYVTGEGSTLGKWQNFSRYWANGWGVCPSPAMKLTTMTASNKADFKKEIDALQAVGGTYHDIGMLWGIRLMSPKGLFADENAEAENKRPISRHIIFMTDGAMAANMGNLGFQGYEHLTQRVGGSIDMSDADLTTRHNNRFLQLCAKAKDKDHDITIWVIGFGVDLNTQLTTCSSDGKAYQTGSAEKLKQIFQSIAGQISRLRLSQ